MCVRPSLRELMAVAAIVAVQAAVLIRLAFATGVTVDEPSHLLSSYLYWQGNDTLKPGDMPPLIKIMGGWIPHLTGLRLPPADHPTWKTNHEWDISLCMMEGLRAGEIRRIYGFSRLPMILFPVGCCLLVWWWGRQIHSPPAGLLAATALAFTPLVLGHGALFKNDLAASFAYIFFWYRAWAFVRAPGPANSAWLGLSLLLAVLSKVSLLILVPVALLLLLYPAFRSRVSWRSTAVMAALAFCVVYIGVQLAWQSAFEQVPALRMKAWEDNPRFPLWSTAAARVMGWLYVPPRLIEGSMSLVSANADANRIYMLGKVYPNGHPAYFVLALALKLDLATLLLFLAGALALLHHAWTGRLRAHDLLWIAPPMLYVTMASVSSLQLGVRLVLPTVVFLALIGGRGIQSLLKSRVGTAVVCALFLWLLGRTAAQYPHYISSFNLLAGGADKGMTYFSDSNLDWGQDMRRLPEVVRQRQIPRIRFAYFGMDNPFAYVSDQILEQMVVPWSERPDYPARYPVEPGYYAISATLLTGQLLPEKYRDYFAEFRTMKPVAKAGYSIFVYRVEASDIAPSSSVVTMR